MLAIDSVTLSFGHRKILSGAYLDCRPGEIVGLLGRNGSGKSSLLKIIFGNQRAQFSHLRIDGQVTRQAWRTGRVAYLPQHSFLPDFVVLGKLLDDDASYDEVLDAGWRSKRAGDLSAGQRKLVECLLTLSLPASFALLDEPFMGVAPIHVENMKARIAAQKRHKGIIVTDHNYRDIQDISDRVMLLHQNAVYPIASHDDLVRYRYLPDL